MPVQCVCLICSAPFTVYPAVHRKGLGKYCSRICAAQAPHARKPVTERFWALVQKTESCWLWTGSVDHRGYGGFTLVDGHTVRAHRFAYELSNGLILPGILCLHTCDVRRCVRVDHLFLGTPGDNSRDMIRKGRNYHRTHPERVARGDRSGARLHPETYRRGEQHPRAKLTENQVREIRRLWATEHYPRKELATRFGVSHDLIHLIINRKVWRHI